MIDSFKMFSMSKVKSQLIAFMVNIAMEHNNTCKELMSRLFRDLRLEVFTEQDFVEGFDLHMSNLDDLVLDNPEAPQVGI